jgi:hypothetical protein
MSDGTKQALSFYFDRAYGENAVELKDQLQPLMNELAEILLRSKPTINPNDFCVYATWGGRVHKEDGTYYGAEIIAQQMASSTDGVFVSGGGIYRVSNGNVFYTGASGSLTSYNPSYRAFGAQDQARMIEILQQWKAMQDQYNFAIYGGEPDGGPSIGETPAGGMDAPSAG